jgi:hypothetical protein
MTQHPYKLRPYHNPNKVDESKVPEGWRMLYADEFPLRKNHKRRCRLLINPTLGSGRGYFGDRENCTGALRFITYIVPVA